EEESRELLFVTLNSPVVRPAERYTVRDGKAEGRAVGPAANVMDLEALAGRTAGETAAAAVTSTNGRAPGLVLGRIPVAWVSHGCRAAPPRAPGGRPLASPEQERARR